MRVVTSAGRTGKSVLSDALSGCVHSRGNCNENQLDRGTSTGRKICQRLTYNVLHIFLHSVVQIVLLCFQSPRDPEFSTLMPHHNHTDMIVMKFGTFHHDGSQKIFMLHLNTSVFSTARDHDRNLTKREIYVL